VQHKVTGLHLKKCWNKKTGQEEENHGGDAVKGINLEELGRLVGALHDVAHHKLALDPLL